ncbi:28S ribosomal protein S24, mitochondrial [Microplitis demolitor]|uniref:28S ribosomal protein S24, mitochondrial n=1 Tax=Microplitis demolitor TaxID=69319 RepID=UPI0004CD650F|nr:28S ribosomal protein S24, mitochondrial [Microplitis demolitor]
MALILNNISKAFQLNCNTLQRSIHVTAAVEKCRSGRYRPTLKRTRALTYEMSQKPFQLVMRKSWNVWNTSNIQGGNRPSETAVEDEFIRRFMVGTWHNIFVSDLIIKRQHNIIRIAGIIERRTLPRKLYFLIGYTQELLSYWLQCPVKMELQSVPSREDVIFKYI